MSHKEVKERAVLLLRLEKPRVRTVPMGLVGIASWAGSSPVTASKGDALAVATAPMDTIPSRFAGTRWADGNGRYA
jgi:hypothetical protein